MRFIRAAMIVAIVLCACSAGAVARAKQDHEYVKPIDWDKIKLADDEFTRWLEKNVVMWQLENRFKPVALDPSKIDEMSGTQCAFFICDLVDVIKLFDWDEKKVGITKKQLIDLVDKGVKRIHAEYKKNPASLHNSTADGCGQTWGALLAWGTWAVWEHLSEDSQKKAVEVLLKEAKIFEKPLKTWNYPNSNIEEHSTQATFFSLLANMMPKHPLNKHWEYCTRHWTYGHVVSTAELAADPVFSDGTRLRDYVKYDPKLVYFGIIFQGGGSIHDDGSVMNHWTVNFGYAKTTSCRFASLLWYKLAGRTPPEGLTTIGVKRTRNFFIRNILPWGGHIGPNGVYGPYSHPPYESVYYLLYWDPTPEAWAAFQMTFNTYKKLFETNSVTPGHSGFSNYYQSKLFGPLKPPAKILSTKQLMKRLSGVHVSPTARYILHRSPESYSIYSWHSFSANGGMLDMDPVTQDTGSDGGVVVRSKRAKDGGYVQDTLIPQSWVKSKVYGPWVGDDVCSVITRRDSKHGVTNYTAFISLPNCNTVLVSRTLAREDMEVDKLEMGKVTFLLKHNPQTMQRYGFKKWPWW
ncbi:MAG: hypothetical protein QGD94_10140, partial [Planctomycetia bacterium]|nr:hypothetical protein [Planctomycetia bacterium]